VDLKRRSVADLKPGEKGVIAGFMDDVIYLKLLEMGCLPGAEIKLNYVAPFGDPVAVKISGYNLSLRLDEAASITLE
jgi:ferrous iron transport protein A